MATKIQKRHKTPVKRGIAAKPRPRRVAAKTKQAAQGSTLMDLVNSIVERGNQIPAEELDRLPTDGSINYKHYLYGHPKQSV